MRRLSDRGIINPDGLFLFSGQGRDAQGVRPWAVVLKILTAENSDLPPHHLWYWTRECLAMGSGLLARLSGPVAVPRCFGVQEQADGAWIWMEHIADHSSPHWGTEQFVFSAGELGRATGAWLMSGDQTDHAWLCRAHARTWADDLRPADHVWDNAFVQQAWSGRPRQRVLQLWDERARFYDALERLPQTFGHFDFQRRNLMIRPRPDGGDELVAIDWAWCGMGPVGGDLAWLVGDSALGFEVESAAVAALDALVFPIYLDGLRAAGWAGHPDLVRLAYLSWIALYFGVAMPALLSFWTHPDQVVAARKFFGHESDELAAEWATFCGYALDCADEARVLLDRVVF